ncbi:MAG TPA: hypothetical protein VH764_02665 [Gemmatimonadales bacterium]|jgi:hypothetical protein
MARDLHYSRRSAATAIVVTSPLSGVRVMYANDELQRWAGRICLLLVAAFGMMGYYWANVRFIPIMAGFAILAGVCYAPRPASHEVSALRRSGQHPVL